MLHGHPLNLKWPNSTCHQLAIMTVSWSVATLLSKIILHLPLIFSPFFKLLLSFILILLLSWYFWFLIPQWKKYIQDFEGGFLEASLPHVTIHCYLYSCNFSLITMMNCPSSYPKQLFHFCTRSNTILCF